MFVATGVLAGLGLVSGVGLGLAARVFAVRVDPRQERIAELLPGANCGGCGYAGCNDYAAAVVRGDAPPDGCPVGGAATAAAVAEVMGVTVAAKARQVALVRCQGTLDVAPKRFRYNGEASCASAALLGGGDKLCGFGCLGLGDCQRACAFQAIEMCAGGVARVLPERCTGCGRCVEACPKDLIALVPAAATVHVLCSNRDRGGLARKLCRHACLGCKKCEKYVGDGSIAVRDWLARVDYERPPLDPAVVGECATGALREVRPDRPAASAAGGAP